VGVRGVLPEAGGAKGDEMTEPCRLCNGTGRDTSRGGEMLSAVAMLLVWSAACVGLGFALGWWMAPDAAVDLPALIAAGA
jgi:hypothetical protein